MAEDEGLDLVEIQPNADPPVCRIMDFGKFKFEAQKKANAAKKKQKQVEIKEVKFRPVTDEGDYQIKLRNMRRFLEEGDKVKVNIRFRGREMSHQELGREMANADRGRPGRGDRDRVAAAPGRPADGDDDRAEEEVAVRPAGRHRAPGVWTDRRSADSLSCKPATMPCIMRGPVRRVCSTQHHGPVVDSLWINDLQAGKGRTESVASSHRPGQ